MKMPAFYNIRHRFLLTTLLSYRTCRPLIEAQIRSHGIHYFLNLILPDKREDLEGRRTLGFDCELEAPETGNFGVGLETGAAATAGGAW